MTKKFTQYLKDALIIKGRIQVPGLGTFISEYQAAEIKEDNKINPPELLIDFSEKESTTDDNILNFMMLESAVPKEVATELLKNFIQYIKESLSVKRNAEIEGLGKLHYDSRKKLSFSTGHTNFYSEASGQNEQTSPVLSKKQQKNAQKVKKKKISKKAVATDKEKKTIPVRKKKLWPVWLIVILLLLAAPLITLYLNKDNSQKIGFTEVVAAKVKSFWSDITSFSKSLKNSKLLDSNDKDSSKKLLNTNANTELNNDPDVKNAINDIAESTDSTATTGANASNVNPEESKTTFTSNTLPATKEKPKEEHFALSTAGGTKLRPEDIETGTKLYLIAGSFRNRDNALKLREELIGMGYQAQVLDRENELNRVALGEFSELQEALSTYMRFHKKKPKIGVWLLIKR